MRDEEDELDAVSTEEQREEAINLANELEEWLYDDGWTEDANTYRKKRAGLAEVRCVCVFINFHITIQPGPVILIFIHYTYGCTP